jgi:hypothetical protein
MMIRARLTKALMAVLAKDMLDLLRIRGLLFRV